MFSHFFGAYFVHFVAGWSQTNSQPPDKNSPRAWDVKNSDSTQSLLLQEQGIVKHNFLYLHRVQ